MEEYGISALTEPRFQNHYYDAKKQDWVAFGCVHACPVLDSGPEGADLIPLLVAETFVNSCKDFGTCEFHRNPTDGIHLPLVADSRGSGDGKPAAGRQMPKLPYQPGVRPPPPRLLDGLRWA